MDIYRIVGNKRRVMLDLSEYGIEEVPLLGVYIQSQAKEQLPVHVHEGLLEIVYLARGELIFTVGNEEYLLKGSDVFVTQPDQAHGTGGRPMNRSFFYWIQLRAPQPRQRFLHLSPTETRMLWQRLAGIKKHQGKGSKALERIFTEMFTLCLASENPLKGALLRGKIVELLALFIECMENDNSRIVTSDIEHVLSAIDAHPEAYHSVGQLAELAGLSTSHFSTKFKKQLGLSPGEYLLKAKVNAAKELLIQTEMSILNIAIQLGFSSSQYFATAFQRLTTCTPSAYRQQMI